jgi:RNA polymerase sigma-70 factor (ECF subfamily)
MSFSKEDAEDMTQDVFIRVYNNLYQYNGKWCFSTWIFRIAVNVFKSEYSKKKNRDSKRFTDVLCKSKGWYAENPEAIFENMETKMEILRMLDSLKFDQKAALILKYVQGFSYREIGEILKISPENAKVRVMRAKKMLVNANLKLKEGCYGLSF